MTRAANNHYWALATEARAALRNFGRAVTEEQWQRERGAIHLAAGAVNPDGSPLSSKYLTLDLFKKVKAEFLSWSKPADLTAQIAALNEDYTRWRYVADAVLDRMAAHLDALGRPQEAVHRGPGRDGYLLYLFRRVGATPAHIIDLADTTPLARWKVMSSLMYRYDQVMRKTAGHSRAAPSAALAKEGQLETSISKLETNPPLHRPFDSPSEIPALAARADDPF